MRVSNRFFGFAKERGHALRLAFALFAVVGAVSPLFAGGGKEVETQIYLSKPPVYIAAGLPATGHDTLTIDNIKLQIDKNTVVKSYTLNIYNKNGEVIFAKSDSNLTGRGFLGDLLNVGEIPSVTIPATMSWPGTDTNGKTVADGEYFYQLTILDSKGKKSTSPPLSVVVDTKPPTVVNLGTSYRIFSPNGDGIRDTETFTHKTDAAYKWIETVRDSSGTVVWEKDTNAPGDTAASDVLLDTDTVWDGKASVSSGTYVSGSVVPEGNYTYRLLGADRANNTVSKELPLILSYSASDIDLKIQGDNSYFNPATGVTLLPTVSDSKGLVSWNLQITDSDGIVYRVFSGDGLPPESITFNGRGNPGRPESDNLPLPDGEYSAKFSTTYDSGAISNTDPVQIILDSQGAYSQFVLDSDPLATPRDQALVFGGAKRPRLKVQVRYDAGETWNAHFERLSTLGGSADQGPLAFDLDLPALLSVMKGPAGSADSSGQMHTTLTWDGTLPSGAIPQASSGKIPDGLWQITLHTTSKAGVESTSAPIKFIRDTRDRGALKVDLSDTVLSPGGDADYQGVVVTLDAPITDDVSAVTLKMLGADGNSYFTYNVSKWTGTVNWNGMRGNNVEAPNGDYTVSVTVDYRNGDQLQANASDRITLDRDRPRATIKPSSLSFAPNGDVKTITFEQSSSQAATWTGTITDSSGKVVKEMTWPDTAQTWAWDGLDDSGTSLPDGTFTYSLSAVNDVGNKGGATVKGIRIDNLSESISVSADQAVISPNGDGYLDTTKIKPVLALPQNLRGWEIRVESEDQKNLKVFQGGTSLPDTVVWDGTTDGGAVADGVYHVTLNVEYKDGSAASRQAKDPVVVVKTPPQAKVSVDPERFSPDNDGYRDTIQINLDARASDRPVAHWKVEILDPMQHSFKNWEGDGVPPANLTWDGKSDSGELVQSAEDYSVLFTVQDELKNTNRALATISVDILVFKEGNRLRIAVPSIQFAGNSFDLFANAKDVLAKNLDTLRRLGWILNRYPDYHITIAGYATYVWAKTAAQQASEQKNELLPLSRNRALIVKEALTILGVKWENMDVAGFGGDNPVVPHSDADNRWKNRRVEFILEQRQ